MNERRTTEGFIPSPSFILHPSSFILALWAAGTVFGEVMQQVAMYLCLLLVIALRRRISLARDVKAYALATGAFALWQAISPAIALAAGTAQRWPGSLRYGQFVDTSAAALAAMAAHLAAPHAAVAIVLTAAWVLNAWVGLFQHFVEWPFGRPFWMTTGVERVHENFAASGPPRYGAGGLLFHRLRFAHGAVAVLGPAAAFASRPGAWRPVAAVLGLHLLAVPYLGFARAALGTTLLVVATAALLALRGRARLVALGALILPAALSLSNDAWRERLLRGAHNIAGGERTLAMSAGWELVKAHPLLGVGFGNHKPMAAATAPTTGVTDYLATDSHNVLLTVWAETGLVGLALCILMHALWVRAALRRARAGSAWAAGALLSWLGFVVLGQVHYLPYHTGVHLTFALIWGLALAPEEQVRATR